MNHKQVLELKHWKLQASLQNNNSANFTPETNRSLVSAFQVL